MRHLWVSSTAILIVTSLSTPLYSAFHFMRINEVMVGAGGDCRIQYVELQMTSIGQRFVRGTSLFFFDAAGNPTGEYEIPGQVDNGNRQGGELPYILIGTAEFAAASDVAPDFADLPAGLLPPEGGRVSFNNASPDFSIDSVAYGAYVGDNGKHGAPAAAPDPLGNESLLRFASGNDNSASFAVGAPTPTNNDFVTGTVTVPAGEQNCFADESECFFEDVFDDLSNWDVITPNKGLDLNSCGLPLVADIGSVEVSDNKMLFIPGMEDQLDLGLPIAFTGLKSSVAADFADEDSYRFKFDMLAQPGIITVAVFVHQHYDFDDGAGTIDVMANSGMGVNFSFDSVAEDSDHAHPDIRLACISEGGVDQGEGDALFTEFDLMVSNQPYTVIMDVDGDDQEGPLTLQVKIYESDQDEPDDYMATWKLTFGLGADPDPDLDHGIFIAALGQSPAALEISNLSVCDIPLKDKHVRCLSCEREPGGSILVRWDNPFDAEDEEITIEVNGTVVDSVGGFEKEFVIDNPPDGDLTIAVSNYSGVPVECQLCQNDPPRALIAGARRATLESAMSGIVYDGSGSGDPEETPLLFLWELTEMPPGATADIGDPFAEAITLTADAEGDYTLELTVTDGGCPGDETPLEGFAEKRITIGEILQKIFRRGDTDGSGVIDISDPIFNLTFQFIGGVELLCRDAADVDDSGVVDISDPIYNLTFQFVGGIDPPPAPGRDSCGLDPTGDALACEDYPGEKC